MTRRHTTALPRRPIRRGRQHHGLQQWTVPGATRMSPGPFVGVPTEEEARLSQRRHTRSKASRGIVTKAIRYQDRRNPPGRPQTLKVDVRHGEHIDEEHAAAMVAARAGVPLAQVKVIEVVQS